MDIRIQNQNKRTVDPTSSHANRAAQQSQPQRTKGQPKRNAVGATDINFSAGEIGFNPFGDPGQKGNSRDKGKTLTELQQEAAYTDVGISQDYMTVMSNTMSAEDYQELSKEGFHFESLDPKEAVTIVDKIKAELARSGKKIVGYTDDIDMETLASAVGSETLARALAVSFEAADIPLTEENIAALQKAWDMASGLEAPTEGTYQYMVDNELEPEVWNFYLAKNSGADSSSGKNNVPTEDMSYLEDEKIQKQIDQVLEQAGYELNEENRQDARWLLERRLPLTEESIKRLKNLREAVVPVTEEEFAEAAAEAIASGKDPVYADLSGVGGTGKTVYEKAQEVLEYYQLYETPEDLTVRRQLEEIRLRMTAEVNVRLLKSGFEIDTAPMEQLIEALREAEKAVADVYFPTDAEAVSKYENWNQTNRIMEELPELPAQTLGAVRVEPAEAEDAATLEQFYAEGTVLRGNYEAAGESYEPIGVSRQTYERAGESYEALMTAPRADLGDSMSKAFRNVEELVRGLGLEPTEENCRAVRILGYNHMEITMETLNSVKEAESQVRALIEKMTPAATLKMIRDGVNPLEQSFAQLNAYFDELSPEYQEQAESYSRYLYGLEQSKQITEQERETYIGVYRLLHQIENKDGAAIGAVVNMQAQLQFSNLLSAVRSGKFRHMDVRATEEFGALKELVHKGETISISEQISNGYEKAKLAELRGIAQQMDQEPAAMLQRGELPANAENLLAAQELVRDGGNPFRTLRQKKEDLKNAKAKDPASEDTILTEASELWELLSDKEDFREKYEDTLDDMRAETEELTLDHAESSLDVRELRLAHRQLGIMAKLSQSEEYYLPMYVGEELASVHLTLEHTNGETGGISIAVELGENQHLEAHLQVKNGNIDGYLLGKTQEEVMKLQTASDIFCNLVNEHGFAELRAAKLPVVSGENIKMTRTSEIDSQGEDPSPDNGTLYHVAKLFLQAIR